ncbi:ParB N-terminal domain-containing protein [Alteromonas abrolhosensis]|uniref:ParB N-terminal domain-containing protein n=1 Tax=Alteromonas abrolhosensis TaxID=1892904 RepID=UPI00096B82A1|nr:ParB N-terminal domain-containing protein [Alteromonas abrolhosensis]
MNLYSSDTIDTDLDPRDLVLDLMIQAREPELIRKSKDREAQITKQSMQDSKILKDLLNGVGIKQPITVFEVEEKLYVVDGFHRTKACLEYLKKKPDEPMTIKAVLVKKRTYVEAFLAAQEMNQEHGVGVTAEEITQSKFRSLIVSNKFGLSISKLMELVGCDKGQAAHYRRALIACANALEGVIQDKNISVQQLAEVLKTRLEEEYYLTDSAWDSKGFPRMRKLANAYSGIVSEPPAETQEWIEYRTNQAIKNFTNMMKYYDAGIFREALRKAVRGQELGITISKRATWESANAYSDEANYEENHGNTTKFSLETDQF